MQFRTIIAAVDLDDDLIDAVLTTASQIAEKENATLHVVSVWPPITTGAPAYSAEVAATSALMTQDLLEERERAKGAGAAQLAEKVARVAPRAVTVMLEGDAADETAAYADKQNADLLITGTHQKGFWGAFFQGSASRELVHDAPCAVFLVTKAHAEKLSS